MVQYSRYALVCVVSLSAPACSSETASAPVAMRPVGTGVAAGTSVVGGVASAGSGAMRAGIAATAGPAAASRPVGTAGTTAPAGSIGTAGASASAGQTGSTAGSSAIGGAGGAGVPTAAVGAAAAGTSAGGSGGEGGTAQGGNSLTGMLGMLGPVKPVMVGWASTNGLENLIYLSTSPLTCAMMQTMGTKWLASLPAGTQVIEIVTGNRLIKEGSFKIGYPTGEVNYAEGSKSSSTEVNATGGEGVVYTKVVPKMLYEGTVNVNTPFTLSGTFHAEWCEGATEY